MEISEICGTACRRRCSSGIIRVREGGEAKREFGIRRNDGVGGGRRLSSPDDGAGVGLRCGT